MPTAFGAYYISFDPNMYDRHQVRAPRPENMYPSDMATVSAAIGGIPRVPVIIQLSTYSVNGANSQSDVFENLVPSFTELGFTTTYVRADNSMMSYIFSRDVLVPEDLEVRFHSWLAGTRREFGAA